MRGGRVRAIGETGITPFILAMNVASWVAFAVGWLKGGHPERFGVAVLMVAALIELFLVEWRIGDLDIGIAAGQAVVMVIFGWFALRSDRWWPLAVTATLALILLVHVLTVLTPVSFYAVRSARVGLWALLNVILLAGVGERWLAGEPAVSSGKTWRRRRPPGAEGSADDHPKGAALSRLSS